eukprot:scaffold9821_cov61-Phaeocystis_antarctica.AAC.3
MWSTLGAVTTGGRRVPSAGCHSKWPLPGRVEAPLLAAACRSPAPAPARLHQWPASSRPPSPAERAAHPPPPPHPPRGAGCRAGRR